MDDVGPPTTRRQLLAGASAGAASALAGCWERLWSEAETTGPEQISMTIKTVPADDDELAATIASQLRENYEAAGIDATHEPIAEAELYRDVLLEGDYDVFVARHPGLDEADALYGLLHSRYVSEHGWQNPFQLTDVVVDDALETQRSATVDRDDDLEELLEHLLTTTPYTVVAYTDVLCGAAEELDVPVPPKRPQDYVRLLARSSNDSRDGPLEVGTYGEGLTERLNPIAVDRSRLEGLVDLLYDPLARQIDGDYVPWLADDVTWEEGRRLRAEVTLREGLTWHDDKSLDADDVAFTYEFLGDTSMGTVDGGVPAPRFRDRQSLVESVDVGDSRTVTVSFPETSREVARRAFTVPILPEHVWADRSDVVANRRTEALATDNDDPVGSGLFRVADVTTDVEIELEPFDDHVLRTTTDRPDVLEGFSQFEGIRFQIAPNPGAIVDALVDGEIDLTTGELPPTYAESIREADGVTRVSEPTDAFYMIGYNSQHAELGHPHVRRVCSQLLDREHAATEFFDGFAEPATTPAQLVGFRDDAWDRDDDVDDTEPELLEFPGSDGAADPGQSRALFRAIHYNYEDDVLLESSG